ncbi:hypothetical protein F443_13266 [Phytophthora nicotianae P1569]|uniref:Uncharacterized protein n=1 Tax=Phytophthora nicotianae P1569 TaxID=1317065 RepID=V9ESN7_PHYNI|nr:hypothetical protein F443_13266 [Phytophthora nicotianae P1569]
MYYSDSLRLSLFLKEATTTSAAFASFVGSKPTELVEHLVRYHASTYEDEFSSVQRRKGSLDLYIKGDDFSCNVYYWLDWIIMENRELSICEKIKTRKYTNLKPLSVNTLNKYMIELETVVQASIKTQLE